VLIKPAMSYPSTSPYGALGCAPILPAPSASPSLMSSSSQPGSAQQHQQAPRKGLTMAPIYPSAYRPLAPSTASRSPSPPPVGTAQHQHYHHQQQAGTYQRLALGPGSMAPQPLQPPLPPPPPPPLYHQQFQQQQQHIYKEDPSASKP
jgi:hypothetical protein